MLFCIVGQLSSQIVINEYSASNLNTNTDSFNKTEDWVELYNSGPSEQDISGWYLSDKDDNLTKWAFPQGTTIAPQAFLLIYCSGKDGVYSGEYHASFKLTQTEGDDIIALSDSSGNVVDIQDLRLTLTDHSNCRASDGSDEWMVCTEPTTGVSNNNTAQASGYTNEPELSLGAGFYSGSQTVTVTNREPNSIIRYTVDGSNPIIESPVYDAPITVASTTVVKARAFSNDANVLPGKMAFSTYFIDEDYSLPVFSVAADRVIELASGGGIWLPIGSIEYFKDKEFVTSSFGELNRHGQDSWVLPHRSIDWISRDEMGYSKAVNAPIIGTSNRDAYQRFMFRNSGDDNYPAIEGIDHEGSTHVRDEYVQTLAQEGDMKLDVRKVERVVLFLNGRYWGVYGMREKVVDHDYTAEYYNQGKEDLQFLSTWGTTDIEYGGQPALRDWVSLTDFILDNDMAEADNYKIVKDSINLISLIDYFSMNQATVASDWLNYNTGWWRGLNPEGSHKKWGYLLWDLDATFDYYINYTGVPNTSAEASLCDIYDISDAIDIFFDQTFGFDPCYFNGGNNSPYPSDDPLFNIVVQSVPSCCSDWNEICQGYYDDPSSIPDPTDDPENCPSILNGSSPYPADDPFFIETIEADSYCCDNWDNICQNLYNSISNGGGVTIDTTNCLIFTNGTSPYPADDLTLQFVISYNPSCCDEWTADCEDLYQDISGLDISDCPVIINGTVPHDIDDPKLAEVISVNPDCCEVWGVSCENDYMLIGGDQYSEPDDPTITDLPGNLGKHEKILLKLFEESPEFNQLYYSRYADLMNTVYSCENMTELLDRMIAVIEPEMPKQIDRWGGSLNEWETNVDELREFINDRCVFLNDGALECHNEIEGQYTVTLVSEPANVGRIDFNTLNLEELPWTGSYFGDMDNLAEAKVSEAYKNEYEFSHWESKMGNDISPNDMQKNVSYRLSMPDTLIAHYKLLGTTSANSNIVINEFLTSNDTGAQDQDQEYDDWIELYNKGNDDIDISGFFLSDNGQNLSKYTLPENTILQADDYLIVWADEDGSQDGLHANFKLSKDGETIFLMDADTVIIDQITYPAQETDITYARKPNGTGDFRSSAPTFSAKNDGTTSLQDITEIDDRLIAYPNPTQNKVTIQLKKNRHALKKIVVTNVYGQQVTSYNDINEMEMTMYVGHLIPGIYLITANDLYTTKLIVE